jgi:hypothetical protein
LCEPRITATLDSLSGHAPKICLSSERWVTRVIRVLMFTSRTHTHTHDGSGGGGDGVGGGGGGGGVRVCVCVCVWVCEIGVFVWRVCLACSFGVFGRDVSFWQFVGFGVFVWRVRLACLFGVFVWRVRLACLFGVFVWRVCLACLFGVFVWCVCLACLFGVFVWHVRLPSSFGVFDWRFVWRVSFGVSFWQIFDHKMGAPSATTCRPSTQPNRLRTGVCLLHQQPQRALGSDGGTGALGFLHCSRNPPGSTPLAPNACI